MEDSAYDRSSYAKKGPQRMSYPLVSSRFSTFGGNLSTNSSMNHVNLRRHLRPADTAQPPKTLVLPQLTRQDAFIADTSYESSLSNEDSDSTEDPNIRFLKGKPIHAWKSAARSDSSKRCRICYGTTEDEHGRFISPCNCRGTIEFVHDTCLQNYLHSDMRIPRQCSVCLGTVSYPEVRNEHDRRQDFSLRKAMIYCTTAIGFYLLTETVRCTEVRKVPGTEFKESSAIGRPEYLWLPIVKRSCWRNGLAGQIWTHASTLWNGVPAIVLWTAAIIIIALMYRKYCM